LKKLKEESMNTQQKNKSIDERTPAHRTISLNSIAQELNQQENLKKAY